MMAEFMPSMLVGILWQRGYFLVLQHPWHHFVVLQSRLVPSCFPSLAIQSPVKMPSTLLITSPFLACDGQWQFLQQSTIVPEILGLWNR